MSLFTSSKGNILRMFAVLFFLSAFGVVVLQNQNLPRSSPLAAQVAGFRKPLLAPCSREFHEDLFSSDEDEEGVIKTLNRWDALYHARVNQIIEEQLEQAKTTVSRAIQCDSDVNEKIDPPGDKLKELASNLPLWETSADLARLRALDMPAVLSEYLRVYECSLVEYNYFLVTEKDPGLEYQLDRIALPPWVSIIADHARIARESLERVLGVLSGVSRLKPLDIELVCLQRSSLDIRNAFALSAEASACLPQAWDAKDPLRDQ